MSKRLETGTYVLTNYSIALPIRPQYNSANSNIISQKNDFSNNYKWALERISRNIYTIQNVGNLLFVYCSNNVLPPADVLVQVSSHYFKIDPVEGKADTYMIYTVDSGVYLGLTESVPGAKVVVGMSGTSQLYQWIITGAPNPGVASDIVESRRLRGFNPSNLVVKPAFTIGDGKAKQPRASLKYKNLVDLPYDLVHVLCTRLSGRDISALLSTCHSMRALYPDGAIWQELCSRFGIEDARVFGVTSFQTVYTQLLHAYGPLLGLWASDHPYKGSVIEYRIDADVKGIVGEVWRFWPPGTQPVEPSKATKRPNLPEYYRFMHIALTSNEGKRVRAELNWYIPGAGQQWYYGPGTASIRVPTLHVVPPTRLGILVRSSTDGAFDSVTLPPFPPSPTAPWYDGARGLPELRKGPLLGEATPDQRHVLSLHCLAKTTNTVFPAALMIRPSHHTDGIARDPFATHEPRLPLEDMRNLIYPHWDVGWFYRRFYPLRALIQEGQDPDMDDWDPVSLEGLWLASYGPHGTEVLFLEYDRTENKVAAWKITGDLNVPRGAQAWAMELDSPIQRSELPNPLKMGRCNRIYCGINSLASTGYFERSTAVNVVGITGEDEICIDRNNVTRHYVRYKGRDFATETKEHLLRRPATWVS